MLPKEKLSQLIESTLPLELGKNKKRPSFASCGRAISSMALLCSIAISSFSRSNNYFAEIEAWTMYIAYVFSLVERWKVPAIYWKKEIDIAKKSIYNALENLYQEIKNRAHLVEGNPFVDRLFYNIRVTLLISLMSVYILWRKHESIDIDADEIDASIREFILNNKQYLFLWGEAAIPQFLSFYWYYRKIDATFQPDMLIIELIRNICKSNHTSGKDWIANPYYNVTEVISDRLGISEQPIEDTFRANSFTVEALFHILVRRNWKNHAKRLWPDYTRISSSYFRPSGLWQYFHWRNKKGALITTFPKLTQKWDEVKKVSMESKGLGIPRIIQQEPIIFLLFLIVYPFRLNPEAARWLDHKIEATQY